MLRMPNVDEKAIKELVKDLQMTLLQADVNVELVLQLSKAVEDRSLKEKLPPGITRREDFDNMLTPGDAWRKLLLQRTIFNSLGQLENKFDVHVSLQQRPLEIFHKFLDRLLVHVRHPQELADSVRQRTANRFQDYSLNVLTRFLTFPRTAAIISGKQIVASPYTSTNFPPFRIFLQLIDSARGAPLNPPGSGLSAV